MYAEGPVEHQKRNQTAALLSFGQVFGIQHDLLEKSISANAEKSVDLTPSFLTRWFMDSPLMMGDL